MPATGSSPAATPVVGGIEPEHSASYSSLRCAEKDKGKDLMALPRQRLLRSYYSFNISRAHHDLHIIYLEVPVPTRSVIVKRDDYVAVAAKGGEVKGDQLA